MKELMFEGLNAEEIVGKDDFDICFENVCYYNVDDLYVGELGKSLEEI